MMKSLSRRQFLKTTGYLSVGFSLFGCMESSTSSAKLSSALLPLNDPLPSIPESAHINAWVRILADGNVQVLTGKIELGQGLTIAIKQIAGEELNIHPDYIQLVMADTGITQNEGYTAGSHSIERSGMNIRKASAAARQILLEMAAKKWRTDIDKMSFQDGLFAIKDQQEKRSLEDLLEGQQVEETIPEEINFKPKDQYKYVGQPLPHPDMEKIVRGDAMYIQDLRLPNMVHARVLRPPVYSAELVGLDENMTLWPGVLKLVKDGSFIGVIAEEEYTAIRAIEELKDKVQWKIHEKLPKVSNLTDYIAEQLPSEHKGKSDNSLTNNRKYLNRVYSKPYIMHGAIGPACAVGIFEDGELQLWSHSQGIYPLRASLSKMTGLAEDAIRIIGMRGSGCYGHNPADDAAADVALLAMAFPGRPIKVQWNRQDEHQWEPYGTAMRMEVSANLNNENTIENWEYHVWSDVHSTRPGGKAEQLIAARYVASPASGEVGGWRGGGIRNSEPYYQLGSVQVKEYPFEGPLRASSLRSLGAYANIFAIESFMDELAELAGEDPLAFRIRHSEDERALAVMNKLQELVANEVMGKGEGLGLAFSRYKNTTSYCAVAAKIAVDLAQKSVVPIKLWAVIDSGEVINPDGLKNQTEGGMIQSTSWTLKEEVLFNEEEILSQNWTHYPIIRFDAVPETEVHIIARPHEPAMGGGEAAQAPTAAAVANAVYAACGKRVYHLPIERYLFNT